MIGEIVTLVIVLGAALYGFKIYFDNKAKSHVNQEENILIPEASTITDLLSKMLLSLRTSKVPENVNAAYLKFLNIYLEVSEELQRKYPNMEITHVVNKMAKSYLPDLVNHYLSLPDDKKIEKSGDLVEVLTGLCEELTNIKENYRNENLTQFEIMAKFIEKKFFGQSIDA